MVDADAFLSLLAVMTLGCPDYLPVPAGEAPRLYGMASALT
jgi:hypothetical protein